MENTVPLWIFLGTVMMLAANTLILLCQIRQLNKYKEAWIKSDWRLK